MTPKLTFHPVTPARWRDLEKLFGERGACAGCWCMYWRLPHAQWSKQKGPGNKRALRRLVAQGPPPGLLAYAGREPIAWCALALRTEFVKLERSRVLSPVDAQPVWSTPCFFVARQWRRRGVTAKLLAAATEYARQRGARIVEGYPIDPRAGKMADAFAWTGLVNAFTRAGFREVARRSPTRPIMRKKT